MSLACNVSSTWRTANVTYANVSSTWRHVPQVYVNISGTWRPVWSYYWNPLGWGACSATCGGGIQYQTVNCTRHDGTVWDVRVCNALIGANPYPTSQACNTHACRPSECQYSIPYMWSVTLDASDSGPAVVYVMWKAVIKYQANLTTAEARNLTQVIGNDGITYYRGTQKAVNQLNYLYEICR